MTRFNTGDTVRETKASYPRRGTVVGVNEVGRVRVSWTEECNSRTGEWAPFGRNLRTWVNPKTLAKVVTAVGAEPFPEEEEEYGPPDYIPPETVNYIRSREYGDQS